MKERSPGFTLLEVLVALAITGLCLGLVSFSLHSVFRAHARARDHLEREQTLIQTLSRMRLYIQTAYLSPYMPNQMLSSFETMDQSTLREPYDALTFTTLSHTTHRRNAKEADLIEVTFFTEPEPPLWTAAGEVQLRRLRLRAGGEINDRFEVEGGTVYTLADHVTRLEFEYLGPDGEWRPEWFPYDNNFNLPCMVRVTLGLRTAALEEEVSTLEIPLQLSRLRCRFDDDRVFERK